MQYLNSRSIKLLNKGAHGPGIGPSWCWLKALRTTPAVPEVCSPALWAIPVDAAQQVILRHQVLDVHQLEPCQPPFDI